MREILFRGKREDNGEWVEGGILQDEGYVAIVVYSDYHGWHDFIEVIPETVSEFTGLTDKNGKKIFEGDILKYKNFISKYNIGYVVYGTGCFSVKDIHSDNRPAIDIVLHESKNDIEVIGNIHDNPELLKGGEG